MTQFFIRLITLLSIVSITAKNMSADKKVYLAIGNRSSVNITLSIVDASNKKNIFDLTTETKKRVQVQPIICKKGFFTEECIKSLNGIITINDCPREANIEPSSTHLLLKLMQKTENKEMIYLFANVIEKPKNYYEILEIQSTASLAEIKKTYKKLALKWHPDKNSAKTKEEKDKVIKKFTKINEAYTILSDLDKRNEYDELYKNLESYPYIKLQKVSSSRFKEIFGRIL